MPERQDRTTTHKKNRQVSEEGTTDAETSRQDCNTQEKQTGLIITIYRLLISLAVKTELQRLYRKF